jgi:tetratricopeptide (TPR) repeat protein
LVADQMAHEDLEMHGLSYTLSKESARAEFEAARNKRLSMLLETARTQLVPLTGRARGDVVEESKAVPLLEMMQAINLELLGADADETQRSTLNLARAYDRVDRYPDSEQLYRTLLAHALRNERREGDWAFIRFMLAGNVYRGNKARAAEALELVDQAISYWRSLPEPPFAMCSATLERSMILGVLGRIDEQKSTLEEGIACVERGASEGSLRRREAWSFMGDYLRDRGDFAQAKVWYERARAGAEDTTDPTTRVWIDACRGEILWMARETARAAGGTLEPALEAEFQSIVAAFHKRDPRNPRLQRWVDAAKPPH